MLSMYCPSSSKFNFIQLSVNGIGTLLMLSDLRRKHQLITMKRRKSIPTNMKSSGNQPKSKTIYFKQRLKRRGNDGFLGLSLRSASTRQVQAVYFLRLLRKPMLRWDRASWNGSFTPLWLCCVRPRENSLSNKTNNWGQLSQSLGCGDPAHRVWTIRSFFLFSQGDLFPFIYRSLVPQWCRLT